jgi:peptidoglycan-associated lipoprotein
MVRNFERVHFEFDSADLSGASKEALDANTTLMTQHTDLKLEVQGHADERGTTDYNLALEQRRGDVVHKYMVAAGTSPNRIKVVSYGEERPLDPGSTERAWAENRRCEFVITWGDAPVRGTSQG